MLLSCPLSVEYELVLMEMTHTGKRSTREGLSATCRAAFGKPSPVEASEAAALHQPNVLGVRESISVLGCQGTSHRASFTGKPDLCAAYTWRAAACMEP